MALTREELDSIARSLGDRLQNSSFGDNSFSRFSARRSRKTDPDNFIEDLDKIMAGGFDKTFKRWYDSSREMTRVLKGSALRDAHDMLVDSLDNISKNAKNVAKSIAQSYSDIIKANKGNHQLQQKIHDAMQSYTTKLKKLDALTSGNEKVQDKPTKNSIKKLTKDVNASAEQLKKFGINAAKVNLQWNGHRYKKLDDNLRETINVNSRILSANRDYADNLARLHERELKARDAMVKSLALVSFKAAFKAINETIKVAESRLKNLQSSTEWTQAIMNGMSPQEMNEWQNANRLTKTLLGDASNDFYKGTEDLLNKFGYVGKDLMDMQTKMASTLMNSGIKPTKKSGEALLNVIGRLQAIEGVSRDQAEQMTSEALRSPYYIMNALNKSEDERIKLMTSQLVESRKITKAIGLSNRYLRAQEQEAVNSRYASVITKIQKSALSGAYIAELERLMGRKLTGRENQLVNAKLSGSISPDDLAEYQSGIGKIERQILSDAAKQSSEDFKTGNFSRSSQYILFENLAERLGMDRVGMAQAQDEATVTKDTRGAAVAKLDDKRVVEDSNNSLSKIEQYTLNIHAILEGWNKNPVGGAINTIGSAAGAYFQYKMIDMIFRKGGRRQLMRGASSLFKRIRGIRSAGAAGATEAAEAAGAAGMASRAGMIGRIGGLTTKIGGAIGKRLPGVGLALGATEMALNGPSVGSVGDTIAGGLMFVPGAGQAAAATWAAGRLGWEAGRAIDENILEKTESGRAAKLSLARGMNNVANLFGLGVEDDRVQAERLRKLDEEGKAMIAAAKARRAARDAIKADTPPSNDIPINVDAFKGTDQQTATKINSLSSDMATGKVVDENGNIVYNSDDPLVKMLETLHGIEKNTQETKEEVSKGNKDYKDIETTKLTHSAYAEKARSDVANILNQRAAGMLASADNAASNFYARIDSKYGTA